MKIRICLFFAALISSGMLSDRAISAGNGYSGARKWNHAYDQTLVMKMLMAVPDLHGGSIVYFDVEKTMSMIKQLDKMTLHVPKIIYLAGWQYNGHDDKYPAFFEVNRAIKRPRDTSARQSLIWLMREARKYHTIVSLHINMTDAYEDSPLWTTYVANDLISKNADGSLMKLGNYNGRQAYQVNYRNEWKKGFAQKRIDRLLELLPPLREAGTVHIDAWMARENKGEYETAVLEAQYQKKIAEYWLSKGIEPTSEFVLDYMIGILPFAWHFNYRTQQDYLDVPASVFTGTRMNPDIRNSDFGLQFLFGASVYGEKIFPSAKNGISDDEWDSLFKRDFYLDFPQYYFLNRLRRLKVEGKGKNRTAFFSNHVEVSLADSTVVEDGRVLRSRNTICFPILWRKDNSLAAYSTTDTTFFYTVAPNWKGYKKANVFTITKNGLTGAGSMPVEQNRLSLHLTAGAPLLLVPVH